MGRQHNRVKGLPLLALGLLLAAAGCSLPPFDLEASRAAALVTGLTLRSSVSHESDHSDEERGVVTLLAPPDVMAGSDESWVVRAEPQNSWLALSYSYYDSYAGYRDITRVWDGSYGYQKRLTQFSFLVRPPAASYEALLCFKPRQVIWDSALSQWRAGEAEDFILMEARLPDGVNPFSAPLTNQGSLSALAAPPSWFPATEAYLLEGHFLPFAEGVTAPVFHGLAVDISGTPAALTEFRITNPDPFTVFTATAVIELSASDTFRTGAPATLSWGTDIGVAGGEPVTFPTSAQGLNSLQYHYNPGTGTSYLSFLPDGADSYKSYSWSWDSGNSQFLFQELHGPGRIDYLLSDGFLVEIEEGVFRLYSADGQEQHSFPLGYLRFAGEMAMDSDGDTVNEPQAFFSLQRAWEIYQEDYSLWTEIFKLYSIRTEDLRTLGN